MSVKCTGSVHSILLFCMLITGSNLNNVCWKEASLVYEEVQSVWFSVPQVSDLQQVCCKGFF